MNFNMWHKICSGGAHGLSIMYTYSAHMFDKLGANKNQEVGRSPHANSHANTTIPFVPQNMSLLYCLFVCCTIIIDGQ